MGELLGLQLMPRIICASLQTYFFDHTDVDLCKGVATSLSESQGYIGAYNDNTAPITKCAVNQLVLNVETREPVTVLDPAKGKIRLSDGSVVTVPLTTLWIVSRDCGFMQNSIPASQIGTPVEDGLRTLSHDPAVYGPVVDNGAKVAHDKYHQPMIRNGKPGERHWQPWFGYTFGWAPFPEWWIWKQVAGKPVGPWGKTGRYIQRAIAGVANYYLVERGIDSSAALDIGRSLQAHFKVEGVMEMNAKRGIIVWKTVPPIPTAPPADGVGPRPVKNTGL